MADNRTLRTVVQNILDELIQEATKKRLLKPLLRQPNPPPRKRKLEKRKAFLQEFDPLHAVTRRKLGVNPGDLLPLVLAKQTLTKLPQFMLLKDYRATLPIGHRLEGDALVFLNEMTQSGQPIARPEVYTGSGGRAGEADC